MGRERRGARGSAREKGASPGLQRAAGGEKGIVRALTFFSPKDLIWPPRSGRGEGESARARGRELSDREGKGRRQDAQRRRLGDPGGARRYCWRQELCVFWGAVPGRKGSRIPQPAAALRPAPNPELPAGVAARRRHPSRAPQSWLHLQICLFWGFSTLVEGIGLRRRNFFPFKKHFLADVWLRWDSPIPFSPRSAEGKGLRWRGWWPRMGR